MSLKQLSRRVDRTQPVALLHRSPVVRAYLAWFAEQHGVDVDELTAEMTAVLTTWRLRNGNRLPAVEALLVEEVWTAGRTVTAVREELIASVAAWAAHRS